MRGFGKGSLNRVMLIGNFGADPELRNLPDGGSVTNFTVATTETWIDRNNPQEKRESTEWHRVTFFGRAAEILHEYGRKGKKVYIEGILRTRKWTDKEGIERYSTEVRGHDFTLLTPPPQRPDGYQGGGYQDNAEGGGGFQNRPAAGGGGDDSFGDMDDDIPF